MWRTVLHQHPLPLLPWAVVLTLALWAALLEARGRRIPAHLLLVLLGLGVASGAAFGGLAGALEALLTAAALALPYFLLAAARGSRGGLVDGSLMGVCGAWLGLQGGAIALLSVSLAGVLYALGFAMHRQRLAVALASTSGVAKVVVWSVLGAEGRRPGRGTPAPVSTAEEMPCGPAIFAGMLIAAVGRLLW
jgi:prepilin signal peptidase PulO-like enzyme (type II secretory pathway)